MLQRLQAVMSDDVGPLRTEAAWFEHSGRSMTDRGIGGRPFGGTGPFDMAGSTGLTFATCCWSRTRSQRLRWRAPRAAARISARISPAAAGVARQPGGAAARSVSLGSPRRPPRLSRLPRNERHRNAENLRGPDKAQAVGKPCGSVRTRTIRPRRAALDPRQPGSLARDPLFLHQRQRLQRMHDGS